MVIVEAWGERRPLTEWLCDPRCHASKRALEMRLERGWPPERAISEESAPKRVRRAGVTRAGEQLRGERHPCALLTDELVLEVRRLAAQGLSHPEIAERLAADAERLGATLTARYVGKIVRRERWGHVTERPRRGRGRRHS